MNPKIFIGLFIFIVQIMLASSAYSLEPDPYRLWKKGPLPDETVKANRAINQTLEKFLIHWEKRKTRLPQNTDGSKQLQYKHHLLTQNQPYYDCARLSEKFLTYTRPYLFKNRFKKILFKQEKVVRYPEKTSFFKDYKQSIYRGFVWPFIMPIAQILNIDGVYLGTDKLDHFFSSGRRYLKIYHKSIRAGLSHEEAQKKAIDFGLGPMEEKGGLGLLASGVFSYADLESNYQGMVMGQDLCFGSDPVLKQDASGRWIQTRKLDFKDYVNPLWDEGFNNSYFAKYRRKKLYKVVRDEHCDQGLTRWPQQLWRSYRKRVHQSFHTRYLKSLIDRKEIPDPKPHGIAAICGYTSNKMSGVSFW